ncbi:heme o synthase [Rubrivirga sp. IMCC45206]|uniref:heme o synthase n=1 Tax=Rubrivirga sp. IMCC45206 TaxID=3391614 RepID=UPI00398FAC7E
MRTAQAQAAAVAPPVAFPLIADFKELTKPGITAFVVVMAAAGYLLAAPGPIEWLALVGLMVGTGLTGGGAGALNHVIERRHDALMARTATRPLPAGRMPLWGAVTFALLSVAVGAAVLALTTNPLTTVLAVATVVLYVAVYTPLKRLTVHNTLIGAVPGALPALGGAAAASGVLDATGWSLFAILYLWQLPHFYALAWMFRADYTRGGFRMLPGETGERTLATIVLVATLALLIAGVLPAAVGQAGLLFMAGMAALGTAFTIPAFSFFSEPNDARAKRLLLASIAYVPAFFVLVVLDFLIRS